MNTLSEEEKALLLQVICEGYPHGLMVNYDGVPYDIATIGHNRVGLIKPFMSCITDSPFIEDVRPYLRDIADMTEEEVKELVKVRLSRYGESAYTYCIKNLTSINSISNIGLNQWSAWVTYTIEGESYTICVIVGRVTWETTLAEIDWLAKNHFNYRLPSHLYIKVTKENNPYRTLI